MSDSEPDLRAFLDTLTTNARQQIVAEARSLRGTVQRAVGAGAVAATGAALKPVAGFLDELFDALDELVGALDDSGKGGA